MKIATSLMSIGWVEIELTIDGRWLMPVDKPTFCKVCGHLAPGCKAYETYDRIGWTKVICQCPKIERPIGVVAPKTN